ncbi:MAG: hypothetical protein DHS20C11_06600 [Lysobacteraceae bacterium]|nr:MAG: hypothetical protein DHS20C11_06600 [Xanthomonadaceae bacterium]
MTRTEHRLNRIAQGYIDTEKGVAWFEALPEGDRRRVLRSLSHMLAQSHPQPQEVQEAVLRSGLKATYTPCVVMEAKEFSDACGKVLSLPNDELVKAFRLWMAIFSISDGRRRATDCKNGCTHEWHNLRLMTFRRV